MDSKLRNRVIVCVFTLVALVFLLVLFVNQENLRKTKPDKDKENIQTDKGDAIKPLFSTDEKYALDPYADPYAFAQDEEFFDKEEVIEDTSNHLSLLVSTIQKDLRVHVVDDAGALLTGQKLQFRLVKNGREIQKTYYDEDEDGMLYLADLDAGEYEVKLKEVPGYEIPEGAVKTTVSDEISYTVLKDISFFGKVRV